LRPELIQSGRNTLEAALGKSYVDIIFDSLKDQHERTKLRNELKERARGDLIDPTRDFAFLFLLIALPLRLTKVTGDVKNAKKAKKA
jgi:hypothetical protein